MPTDSELRTQTKETIDQRIEQAMETAGKECEKRLPPVIVPERFEDLTFNTVYSESGDLLYQNH